MPYLSWIELREVNTDIKSDSSASDFVRLIWVYLASLYMTSYKKEGNHLGVIVLDEPAQHSMAETSMNSLLKSLAESEGLQSILAASFDESDHNFIVSTHQVDHHLIQVGKKLLTAIN